MSRQINAKLLKEAAGNLEGDYLELRNQWARVFVERREREIVVTGDLKDIRASEMRFPSITQAVVYALESLAAYEQGALR